MCDGTPNIAQLASGWRLKVIGTVGTLNFSGDELTRCVIQDLSNLTEELLAVRPSIHPVSSNLGKSRLSKVYLLPLLIGSPNFCNSFSGGLQHNPHNLICYVVVDILSI